jgi:hypothetical protein
VIPNQCLRVYSVLFFFCSVEGTRLTNLKQKTKGKESIIVRSHGYIYCYYFQLLSETCYGIAAKKPISANSPIVRKRLCHTLFNITIDISTEKSSPHRRSTDHPLLRNLGCLAIVVAVLVGSLMRTILRVIFAELDLAAFFQDVQTRLSFALGPLLRNNTTKRSDKWLDDTRTATDSECCQGYLTTQPGIERSRRGDKYP